MARASARVAGLRCRGLKTSYSITSRFANIGGNPFTVSGPKTGRDSVVVVMCNGALGVHERLTALRRIIIANLPVFDAFGMVQINFSQQHTDSVSGEFAANVFQSVGSLTCLAPARVTNTQDYITEVDLTVSAEIAPVNQP